MIAELKIIAYGFPIGYFGAWAIHKLIKRGMNYGNTWHPLVGDDNYINTGRMMNKIDMMITREPKSRYRIGYALKRFHDRELKGNLKPQVTRMSQEDVKDLAINSYPEAWQECLDWAGLKGY